MAQLPPIDWIETKAASAPRHLHRMRDQNAHIQNAVGEAREASEHWKKISLANRLTVVRVFSSILASRAESTSRELCGDRASEEFLVSEIIPLLDACRYLEKNAGKLLRPKKLSSFLNPVWLRGVRHELVREPLGVVLIIGPSNYPLFLPAVQCLQAITAGNAILLEPAEGGEAAAKTLAALLRDAGLPGGVLQILPSCPSAVMETLAHSVDKVVLTGSLQTGRAVLAQAAETVTPTIVELSGSDGVLIYPDADLKLAAECVAFGLTLNSGHTCIAPRRAFVWTEVAEHFQRALAEALARRPSIALNCNRQHAYRSIVVDAVRGGAHLLHGSVTDCAIHAPIVFGNVALESSLLLQENWGPILSVVKVENENEAIHAFNRSSFGLGASIFTRSEDKARAAAQSLVAGSICINDIIVPTADGRIPFTGRKHSGFGATRGGEGLLEMTALKVISSHSGRLYLHLRPQSKRLPDELKFLSAYIEFAYGRRMRGFFAMCSALFRSRSRNGSQNNP